MPGHSSSSKPQTGWPISNGSVSQILGSRELPTLEALSPADSVSTKGLPDDAAKAVARGAVVRRGVRREAGPAHAAGRLPASPGRTGVMSTKTLARHLRWGTAWPHCLRHD